MSGQLRVAVIGTGFMGRMHAHAWRTAHRFFDLPRRPVLELLVGRDGDRTTAAADRLGFEYPQHFSRMFRQTFGMTPSSVLKPLKKVTLLA